MTRPPVQPRTQAAPGWPAFALGGATGYVIGQAAELWLPLPLVLIVSFPTAVAVGYAIGRIWRGRSDA